MARVVLTPQLQRFIDTPTVDVPAATLGDALEASFAANPRLRGYVLDEQGHVRKHVAIFIDGELIRDRQRLDVALSLGSEVFVLPALSGG